MKHGKMDLSRREEEGQTRLGDQPGTLVRFLAKVDTCWPWVGPSEMKKED